MRKKVWRQLSRLPWQKVWIFLPLLIIFILNAFHEEYPDEYDNLLGGRYILEGKVPYRDWFQHHQPLAYILAAVLLPFSGRSFVRFRFFLGLAFLVINLGGYWLVRKRFKKPDLGFYLVYLFLVALGGTFFWGQMLLADTLAAYLIIPTYALILLKTFSSEEFETADLIAVSLLVFLSWLTSMTYTYLLAAINLYAGCLFFQSQRRAKVDLKKILKRIVLVLGGPFFLFFLYLGLTRSFGDYWFANITYNQRYYIYNYPRPPGAPINPVRYAAIIAHGFFNNFLPILSGIPRFSLADPFNVTLALSQAAFLVYLVMKKKYSFLFPFLAVLIYSNSRSNPQAIRETDYQASVYILSSFFLGMFVLAALIRDLDRKRLTESFKVIGSFLLIVLGIYWSFNGFFVFLKWFQKFHAKYMGEAPLIYDRPEIAPILNQLVGPDDYAWAGPFEFKDLFYLRAKVPSKYHWFLQHAASSEKIKREMLADFADKRPRVIVFKRHYTPWGGDASGYNYFFVDFLKENYFRIFELNQTLEDFEYQWTVANPRNLDIDSDFNFDQEKEVEILEQLLGLGMIERVDKEKSE